VTDFAILNTGSGSVSVLDFSAAADIFQTVATLDTGGTDPTAMLVTDFNHDGLSDLVVANTGDGKVDVFLGAVDGPQLNDVFTDPDMPHPSAVALSAVQGDTVFYATTEGLERAFRFELPGATPPVAQPQPVTGSPVSFAPVLLAGNPSTTTEKPGDLPPTDLLLVKSEDNLLGQTVGQDSTLLVQAPSTLGAVDLLAVAEGGKGQSSDLWTRMGTAWQEARATWIASLDQSASTAWSVASDAVADVTGGAEGLARPFLSIVGLDHLELPDLHWRDIGTQLVQCVSGAMEGTWNRTAAAEMEQPFSAALDEAFTPWLPISPRLDLSEAPALRGVRDAVDDLGTLLPSVPLPWNGTEGPRQEMSPAPGAVSAVFAAGEVVAPAESIPAALAPPPLADDSPGGALLADCQGEERGAFWLALVGLAIAPVQLPRTRDREARLWRRP
jgi:hypothetical protein